jgi:Protein kinase domain
MNKDSRSLREELYRVIDHYAELTALARQGEANPISQIGRIVKKRFPILLVVIRELIPRLERDELTFEEAVFQIIREAQQFPDLEAVIDSRQEIQRIETDGAAFLYAVKWLDSKANLQPSPQEVASFRKTLSDLNRKYRDRYAFDEEDTATVIPFFLTTDDGESKQTTMKRMADLVKRAVLELHHLMVEYEPAKSFFGFPRSSRKEIESDVMRLAWFLFRCGYSVDRISTGYYKDLLTEFLNDKLLDCLIDEQDEVRTMTGLSRHLLIISLLDIGNFFEHPNDYRDMDDPKEVARHAKVMQSKARRGADLLKKLAQLHKLYAAKPQARLANSFLLYRYYSAFRDYHGDHRAQDPRQRLAVAMYKPIVDNTAMEERAQADLQESGQYFSSKTREEMSGILSLIMNSLKDPSGVRGKRVKILGEISSGAMGEVSIGIYKDNIVALKRVKSGVSGSLGDPIRLLEYEAAIHERVQRPEQSPYVVEFFGLEEQEGEKLLINGYHPNDNLTQLVEKNWQEKHKPPFSTTSKLTLATLEVICAQLLACLRLFRDKGVVHRDLKTDNILYLVDENEEVNRIKVIDFGVALAVGPGAVKDMFVGKVVGTFSYMAPEQARGKCVFQSDLYSVGAIFTVLMTGRLPLVFPKTKSREDLVKQLARIEKEARPSLTQLNPWLKRHTAMEHMAATVERMLDVDPLRRPDVEEVEQAFKGFFQHLGNEKHSLSIYYQRD